MAGRNIQVNLQFNANTQNAKAQLKELQNSLNNLINSNATGKLGITPQIQEAVKSAMDLKIALNNATNVDTGKLNLNKFQSELDRSGRSIQQYAQQMQALGPAGVKTFSQIAQAVAQADTRLFSLQGGMKKLANTFMNTVRWQVTSAAIMAVTSAISETVSYAKELDTSLNNIRIVTGKSADQMAKFAETANKAAKQLSTTTRAYSDASLIYYQQGLNDKAVKERTDVTVKLANVVGESAQEVSEWMTAIWNNFDDGSESLEHYADILAKLGAATASSADEIAGGLEKFAAVADTIGLSYEYAASALATITAETRQSEDVVGTALKTLFSRMEQLKLGETLDDGTTLGQYSLALEKIGVNIKDANGELKDMDIILEQTGARWSSLARDEQIALAQSVAGIRQYTQFMALMDNWDVMEKNLKLTEQANGALMEQQRIYEESTKAAEDRFKTASEAIKATLLGGDDLNKVYNFGAEALEVVNDLLEAFGGLPTILLAVATALTKVYQPQIASFFSQMAIAGKDLATNIRHPIKAMKGENVSSAQQFKLDTVDAAKRAMAASSSSGEVSASNKMLSAELDAQQSLIENDARLNASVKQRLKWQIKILQSKRDEVLLLDEAVQKAEQEQQIAMNKANKAKVGRDDVAALTGMGEKAGKLDAHTALLGAKISQATTANVNNMGAADKTTLATNLESNLSAMTSAASDLDIKLDEIGGSDFETISKAIETLKNNGTINVQELQRAFEGLQNTLKGTDDSVGAIDSALSKKSSEIKAGIIGDEVDLMSDLNGNNRNATSFDNALSRMDENKFDDTKAMAGMEEKDSGKQAKTARGYLTEYKERAKALAKEQKSLESLQKTQKKGTAEYEETTKKLKANRAATRQLGTEITKFKKNVTNATAMSEDYGETLDGLTETTRTTAEGTTIVAEGTEEVVDGFEDAGEAAENGGAGFTHWSDALAQGISNLATYAMGLNMLSNAFESLFSSMSSGELTVGDVISSLSSILMSTLMLIPVILSATQAYRDKAKAQQEEAKQTMINAVATQLEVSEEEAGILVSKVATKQNKEEAKSEQEEAAMEVINALGGVAEQAGEGPKGWVTAAISAAMIAPIAAMIIGSSISGLSGGSKEQKQEDVSKGIENIEAINENQELASSVKDLTEEYQDLRESGESTAEILENMQDKIPGLIDSYKELAKTLGMHIDVSGLEEAYRIFQETGDITVFQRKQEEIDQQIKDREKTNATTTTTKARNLVMDAARQGDGRKKGNDFFVRIGDANKNDANEGRKYFEQYLGDYWDSDIGALSFDMTNDAEIIDAYNAMLNTRDAMIAGGVNEETNDFLRELNREIKEMADGMPDLIAAQETVFEIAKEEALLNEEQFNSDVGLQQLNSLEEYKNKRQELIDTLKEEKQWTEEQAAAYLAASDAYGKYEETLEWFGEGGLANFNANASKTQIEQIQEWFMSLPEDERTLAMTIDYSVVGSVEQAKEALEEARIKAEKAAILQEATSLEVEESEFKMYSQLLAATSDNIEQDSVMADRLALSHYKLNKGLEALTKNWANNLKVIQSATAVTPEYAAALGEVSEALEQAFGVPVSSEFITENLGKIQSVAEGDSKALQELQNLLAEDYVTNMVIGEVSINDNAAITVDTARQTLQNMLNDLDTSIEIGEGATISDEYLNTLQQMLDAGQITEEQLQTIMRAKGFEFEITGWKEVDGPQKTIRRTHQIGSINYEEVIDETEKMQVPIINGEGDAIKGTASKATAIRSTDASVINQSTLQSGQETGRDNKKTIDNLKKEKDRYRDINEELEDIERNLEEIRKKKDRAFGKDKLKYIQQEKQLLDQQIESQKEYIKQIQKAKEEQYQDVDNYGFSFDANTGRILNYSEVYDKMLAKYDAGLKAAGDNETLADQWDEWWETFTSNTDAYSDTLDLLEDETTKLNDLQISREDLDYEDLEYTVELKTIVNDSGLKKLDFSLKLIEDDAYAAAEAIALMGQKAELYGSNFNANEQGIRDLLAMKGASKEAVDAFMNGDASGLFGLDLNQQDFDLLQQYQDGMIDSYDNLKESFDGIFESMDGVFEQINEEFDDLDSTLEHTQSVLESYQNIIELAGASTLGISDAMQLDIMDAQLDVANTMIQTNKAQYDKNVEMLAEAREGLAAAGNNEAEKKKWEESIKLYEEQVRESEQEWLDALQNGLELSNQRREKAVDTAIKEFLKETTGYSSMDELQQIYDQQKQLRDLYVTDYEKVYSLSKLSRELDKSINDTSNINAKKQLLSLEEKINKAKEAGVKMSSYELQNLEREYQIELAKIALEEAQNAKSTVRLRRNAEGGISYVYTADQSALDEAQQKYEDAIYASQKANDEWLNSAQEGLMQATATYIEQMATINTATYESEEERNEAIAALNEWYLGQQRFYTEQIDIVLQNNSDLYNHHVETMDGYYDDNEQNFMTMSKVLQIQNKIFNDDFQSTFVGGLDKGCKNAEGFYNKLVTAVGGADGTNPPNSLLGKLEKAQSDWYNNVNTNFINAGTSIDKFRDDVGRYLGDGTPERPGVKKTLNDVSAAIDTLTKKTDFTEAKNAATTYGSEVATAMETAAKQIGSVNSALSTLITKWSGNEGVAGLPNINKTITVTTKYTDSGIETLENGNGDSLDPNTNKFQAHSSTVQIIDDWKDGNLVGQRIVDEVRWDSQTKQYYYKLSGLSGEYTENQLKASNIANSKSISKENPLVIPGDYANAGSAVLYTRSGEQFSVYNNGRKYSLNGMKIVGVAPKSNPQYFMLQSSSNNVYYVLYSDIMDERDDSFIKSTFYGGFSFQMYDTGGYTGNWGPEGRLAMLHQKEIVLNAHDTENILQVVDMVRQMATQLDFNALTMARGLGDLLATAVVNTGATQLDQNVTITAEFPNATNREEIQAAFGDLVNLAAQYASRK